MSIAPKSPKARVRRTVEASRENILAAAETILIEAGPQTLKLVEVARAAGVSPATLIHHFGSIDGVQTALMSRMIRRLVDRILALKIDPEAPGATIDADMTALFDAFEAKGAARLAAWLEMIGEGRRLGLVREAVRAVGEARDPAGLARDVAEDFTLLAICMALGVGLFGPTLSSLLERPERRARDLALDLLRAAAHRGLAQAQGGQAAQT